MSNPKRTRKEIREAIKKIKIKRELTYNKWIKYIHDYQLNKNKIMKKDQALKKSVICWETNIYIYQMR